MFSISCPQCGKVLKVLGETTGRAVNCPRCGELVATGSAAARRDEPPKRSPPPDSEQARGLFRGMSSRERWAVAGVAAVAAGSLLLGGHWAVPLIVCSALVLLIILHGHATGCPACGKWWSRVAVKKEWVDSEGFDENGAPYGRSVDRTTFRCARCWHQWAVTDADAHQPSGGGRPQPHRG